MAIKKDRMKGIREKTSSAMYAPLIPFGTDGKLVDMLSGLDLEEDLIIGGDHHTVITQSDESTTISEIFTKQADIDAGTAKNYYKIDTTLIENDDGSTTIDRKLWYIGEASSIELVQRKLVTIAESDTETEIKEVLNP